jgi:hypothetical protein
VIKYWILKHMIGAAATYLGIYPYVMLVLFDAVPAAHIARGSMLIPYEKWDECANDVPATVQWLQSKKIRGLHEVSCKLSEDARMIVKEWEKK